MPGLVVDVATDDPVLLVEGEMLVGAKQNRTLDVTVLCPGSERTLLPVSCVEQGRWGEREPRAPLRRHAPSRLRSLKTRGRSLAGGADAGSTQAELWDEVSQRSEAFSVSSPTDSLEDVFDAVEPRLRSARGGPRGRG